MMTMPNTCIKDITEHRIKGHQETKLYKCRFFIHVQRNPPYELVEVADKVFFHHLPIPSIFIIQPVGKKTPGKQYDI